MSDMSDLPREMSCLASVDMLNVFDMAKVFKFQVLDSSGELLGVEKLFSEDTFSFYECGSVDRNCILVELVLY